MAGTNGHAPVLPGWVTADQAATVLGVSRQTSARIFQRNFLRTIHAVGERPMYVARVEEVKALAGLKDDDRGWDEAAKRLRRLPAESCEYAEWLPKPRRKAVPKKAAAPKKRATAKA